uniref:Extracellular protein n=1 Tax=Pfiesteria piscicida TaxID=71001 RepID=A3E3J4_PFIPI|nr:extracellular protein [Pfiesteria piscicida]
MLAGRRVFLGMLVWCACSIAALGRGVAGEAPNLAALAKFRQQHRRTVDGRLCAPAFVQSRQVFTGCADSPDPNGESGRPWCYVEAQAATRSGETSWAACAPVTDYARARSDAQDALRRQAGEAQQSSRRLSKAQRAVEDTLDMLRKKC